MSIEVVVLITVMLPGVGSRKYKKQAPSSDIPPVTKNGRQKPPASNSRPPIVGPTIMPRPKHISVVAYSVASRSGKSMAMMVKQAVIIAAPPSEPTSRSVSARPKKTPLGGDHSKTLLFDDISCITSLAQLTHPNRARHQPLMNTPMDIMNLGDKCGIILPANGDATNMPNSYKPKIKPY